MDTEYRRRLDLLFGGNNPNNSYRWKEADESVIDILETTSDVTLSTASSVDTKIDLIIPVDMQARKLDKSRFTPYAGGDNDSGESSATLGGSHEDEWEDVDDAEDEANSSIQKLRSLGAVKHLTEKYSGSSLIRPASSLLDPFSDAKTPPKKAPSDPLKDSPTKARFSDVKSKVGSLSSELKQLRAELEETRKQKEHLEQKLAEPIELVSATNTVNSSTGTVLMNEPGIREQSSMPELKSILKKPSTDAMTYRAASEGAPQNPKMVQLKSPEKSLSYNSSFVSSATSSEHTDNSPSMASTDLSRFQEQPNTRSTSASTYQASHGPSVESYDDDFELRSFDGTRLEEKDHPGDNHSGDHCANCDEVATQLAESQRGLKELSEMVKGLLSKENVWYPNSVYLDRTHKNPDAEKMHGSYPVSPESHLEDNTREYASEPSYSPNQLKDVPGLDHLGIYPAPQASSTPHGTPPQDHPVNSGDRYVNTATQTVTSTTTPGKAEGPVTPVNTSQNQSSSSKPTPRRNKTNYEAFYRTFRSYYGSFRPRRGYGRPHSAPTRGPRVIELNTNSPPRLPRTQQESTPPPPASTPRIPRQSSPSPPSQQSSRQFRGIALPEPTPELIASLEHIQRLSQRLSENHARLKRQKEQQGQEKAEHPPPQEEHRGEMKVPNLAQEDDLISQLSYVEDLSRPKKPNLRVDIADDYNFINDELNTPISSTGSRQAVRMISELNRMSSKERDELLSFVTNCGNAPQKTQGTQTPTNYRSGEKELSDLRDYIKSLPDGQSILDGFDKPHRRTQVRAKMAAAKSAREAPVNAPSPRPQNARRMITADMMPDAHRNVPHRRKLYYKLKLDKVDNLDIAQAHNILKNTLIQLMVPFDELQTGVVSISKDLSEKIASDKFVDQVHRALYNGAPMAKGLSQRDHATCLHNMILHLVELCSR